MSAASFRPIEFLTDEQLRGMAIKNIQDRMDHLLADAEHMGLVVTIQLEPATPLAMGHYQHVVDIRERRIRAQ